MDELKRKKRKALNKKILTFGCLPIIAIFLIILLIGVLSGSDSSKSSDTQTNQITAKTDSVTLAENRVQDSIATANREKAKNELKSFRINKDEFKESKFYYDPRTPKYTNVNFIYPYVGEKDDQYWLRLRFQYTADDWLFIKKAIILVDGVKYVVTGNWERDHKVTIWEWLDIPVDEEQMIILNSIANSKSAKIRYIGQQYHADRTISSKEKGIIKETLNIYKKL